MIIFYDIPSQAPGCAWSCNTWKVRYCLNYKQIPYKTQWIEYPDIEPHCKALGILPTARRRDGRDYYSLPAIHDTTTGAYISDSLLIAEYLEKTFPETPTVFPNSSQGLQTAFISVAHEYTLQNNDFNGFIAAPEWAMLNPASQGYFRNQFERIFGKTLENLEPQGEEAVAVWEKHKNIIGKIDAWFSKTDDSDDRKTPYLMGNTVSWADLVMAAYFIWLRTVFGEESSKWRDIKDWHEGRWKNLLDNLQAYEGVN